MYAKYLFPGVSGSALLSTIVEEVSGQSLSRGMYKLILNKYSFVTQISRVMPLIPILSFSTRGALQTYRPDWFTPQ